MSRSNTLTVLGLYSYDSSLFSEMVYPTGFSNDDKQTVVGNILAECAELEILFPDWNACKEMIGLWSKINLYVWNKIFTAANLTYNPIENYNRTELETVTNDLSETHSGNDVNASSGNDITSLAGSDGVSTTTSNTETNGGTDTSTNSVTTYDSDTLKVHDTNSLQHGHTVTDSGTGSSTTTYGKRETLAHGKTETLTHGEKIVHDDEITKESHISGNIGVTTSQQMLEQEIEVAAKLNVMQMIVQSFKERFCILVY